MAVSPNTYRVQGTHRPGASASIIAGDQTIPMDASWGSDVPSRNPGPADLLASALAGCILKNVERSAVMMPFRYEQVDVEVIARRQDSPPRFVEFEYRVHVVTPEDERRVALLHRNLSKFGTVFNTLSAACDVHGTVTAEPSDEADSQESAAHPEH